MPFYTPGHLFYLLYANEPSGITEAGGGTPTLPAIPSSLTILGQIDPADIRTEGGEADGVEHGYGAGSPISLYQQEKGWTGEMDVNIRIASIDFIQYCLWAGSVGDYGLDSVALYYGTTTAAKVFRLAQCNNISFDFREGSGSELRATANMWGTYPDTATVTVPTLSGLRTVGAPATWHDMTSFKYGVSGGVDGLPGTGGTEARQSLAGISFSEAHDLERKGFRQALSGGAADASRATYALMLRSVRGEGEMQLHAPINETNFGDIEMVVGTTLWRLVNVTRRRTHRPGTEASQQLSFNVPIQFDYVEVNDLEEEE